MRRMYSLAQLKNVVDERLASGQVPEAKLFENIVDKDGHKRFIEDNITTTEISGITFSFAKWSLSGTHLLIVVAGSATDTTVVTTGTKMFEDISIPQWIRDKIVNIASRITFLTQSFYANDDSTQTCALSLTKRPDDKVDLIFYSGITFNKDRSFRVQIDLLIDNE